MALDVYRLRVVIQMVYPLHGADKEPMAKPL
jgi:hypothetical protein